MTKGPGMEEAIGSMEDTGGTVHRHEENTVSQPLIKIELMGKTLRLNKFQHTLTNMLEKSDFGKHMESHRFLPTDQSIMVKLKDLDNVEVLTNITSFKQGKDEWPIRCSTVGETILKSAGVIKGVHPSISDEIIKNELKELGYEIDEVKRISNKSGLTYVVKITFQGPLPKSIKLNTQEKTVFKYNSPPRSILCFQCGRGAHSGHNCRAEIKNAHIVPRKSMT